MLMVPPITVTALSVPPTIVAARTSEQYDGATDNGKALCSANDSGGKDFFNGIDGTADDGSSEDLFDSINGATDNGNSVKCSANDSGGKHLLDGINGTADDGGSKDLLNGINRATNDSDSVKCSANDSGGKHLFDGINGTAEMVAARTCSTVLMVPPMTVTALSVPPTIVVASTSWMVLMVLADNSGSRTCSNGIDGATDNGEQR